MGLGLRFQGLGLRVQGFRPCFGGCHFLAWLALMAFKFLVESVQLVGPHHSSPMRNKNLCDTF